MSNFILTLDNKICIRGASCCLDSCLTKKTIESMDAQQIACTISSASRIKDLVFKLNEGYDILKRTDSVQSQIESTCAPVINGVTMSDYDQKMCKRSIQTAFDAAKEGDAHTYAIEKIRLIDIQSRMDAEICKNRG